MFYDFLMYQTTLIAVILPMLLSLIALTFALKTDTLPPWHVAAGCAGLLPVSYALSYWTFSGYHPMNLFLPTIIVWCVRKELTAPTAFALVFAHTLIIDLAGSWAYAASHYPDMSGWYAGVGGGGCQDLLLILPIISVAAVLILDKYLAWSTRSTALQTV